MTRDTRAAFRRREATAERWVDEGVAAVRAEREARYREAKEKAAEFEASRPRFTRDDLLNAVVVKDKFGWQKVIRVNSKTITLEGEFGPRKVLFERVYEYRDGAQ